jgi:hypothetical protein
MFFRAGHVVCLVVLFIIVSAGKSMAGQNRARRVIAELSCQTDFEDSMRVGRRAHGEDRRALHEAAHRVYEADRRRARKLSKGSVDFPLLRIDRAFNDGQQNWPNR